MVHFEKDWTNGRCEWWVEVLRSFVGVANVRALELGVFEGRSTRWFLDNVLTGENTHIDCVDPWELIYKVRTSIPPKRFRNYKTPVRVRKRFEENVMRLDLDRAKQFQMFSHEFFAGSAETPVYDFVYVDGDHSYAGCLYDLRETFKRLKHHGIMIVDDTELIEDVLKATKEFADGYDNAKRIYAELTEAQWYFEKC
jgi:predicted O-methyltransferase YrrM